MNWIMLLWRHNSSLSGPIADTVLTNKLKKNYISHEQNDTNNMFSFGQCHRKLLQ